MFAQSTAQASAMGTSYHRGFGMASLAGRGFERTLGFVERRARRLYTYLKFNLLFGGLGLGFIFHKGISAGREFNKTMTQATISVRNTLRQLPEFEKSPRKAQIATEQLVNNMRDLARITPFATKDIVKAGSNLLSSGLAIKEVIPTLKGLSAGVAGTGQIENFPSVMEAAQRMLAVGKVQLGDLTQMATAGIPVFAILRDKMNLTQEEMGKITELGLDSDKVLQIISNTLTKRYGRAMEEVSQTREGLRGGFKSLFSMVAGGLIKPLDELEVRTLKRLNPMMRNIRDKFTNDPNMSIKAKVTFAWDEFKRTGIPGDVRDFFVENAAGFGRNVGQALAGAINAVFGAGGGKGKGENPFFKAGKDAVTNFAKGFTDKLKTGEILTSPLGRVLEAYFAIKFGPRLFRALSGGGKAGGGGGSVDILKGAIQAVEVVNWPPGLLAPGGGGPGGVAPVPTGRRGGKAPVPMPYPGAPGRAGVPGAGWTGRLRSIGRGGLAVGGAALGATFIRDLTNSLLPEGRTKNVLNQGIIASAKDLFNRGDVDPGELRDAKNRQINRQRRTRGVGIEEGEWMSPAKRRRAARRVVSRQFQEFSAAQDAGKKKGKKKTEETAIHMLSGFNSPSVLASVTARGRKLMEAAVTGMGEVDPLAGLAAAFGTAPAAPARPRKKKHGGGLFRARSRGGEGLALLRDGERVVPASGAGGGGSMSATSVSFAGAHFHVRQESDIDSIATALAQKIENARPNHSVLPLPA